MIRRALAVSMLLLLLNAFSLFGEDLPLYEPYEQQEFPQWLHDLRRAESLFIGSLPIAYGAVTLTFSLLETEERTLTTDDYLTRLAYASMLSGALALADYIVGLYDDE